jgi:hypothetical protein
MSWFSDDKAGETRSGGIWDSITSAGGTALSLLGGAPAAIATAIGGLADDADIDKPRYTMGEEYAKDEGLWGMKEAAQNDPLLAAELNRGKDIHQLLGMQEPTSMDEQLRRMERNFLKMRGGAEDPEAKLQAMVKWKNRTRGLPGGSSW